MANQLLSELSATATSASASNLLLIESSTTHKKITFANLTQDLFAKSDRQEMQFASVALNRSQIQNLFTTPISAGIPAPGSERYIQIMSCSAFLDHGGTSYTGGADIIIESSGGIDIFKIPGVVNQAADYIAIGSVFGNTIIMNNQLFLKGSADANGDGGSIRVFFQYVIVYTGAVA